MGESMRKALKTAGELTSNGLAIVGELSSVLTSLEIPAFNRRRLLSEEGSEVPASNEDGFPSWVTAGKRRLLAAGSIKANVVVAKDGSGKYKTINEALKEVPVSS